MDIFLGIVVGLVVLMILVVAHEFGHFIVSKLLGVPVDSVRNDVARMRSKRLSEQKKKQSKDALLSIKNIGDRAGIEKTQIYAQYTDSRTYTPHFQLCGIKAVELEAGEKATVTFEIDEYWLKAVTDDGTRVDPDGKMALYVGGHQPDSVSNKLMGYECIELKIK